MDPIVRTVLTQDVKALNKRKRIITFVGTKETQDRTGDIILVDGWELDNFHKNPVFLWNHNTSLPPIGKVLSIVREGKALIFEVEFAKPEVNEFADTIFKLFAEGFLTAVSVGFIPKDMEPIMSDDGMFIGVRILRQELLELSGVNVPAHQDALAAGLYNKEYEAGVKAYEEDQLAGMSLETFTKIYIEQEETDMNKLVELEARVDSLTSVVGEQAKSINSLITLRETVDLSKGVMDTLNKSIVSLMSEKQTTHVLESDDKGLTPQLPPVDPSALLKTLDEVLSQFKHKAFKPKGDK